MSSKDITPREIAAWLRKQADKFMRMAEEIEGMFGLSAGEGGNRKYLTSIHFNPVQKIEFDTRPHMEKLSRLIRDLLAERSMRRSELASRLGVDERLVERVAEADECVEVGERGWFKLKPTQEEKKTQRHVQDDAGSTIGGDSNE